MAIIRQHATIISLPLIMVAMIDWLRMVGRSRGAPALDTLLGELRRVFLGGWDLSQKRGVSARIAAHWD